MSIRALSSPGLPRGRDPSPAHCLRTGFALKRLSPLHRSRAVWRGSSSTLPRGLPRRRLFRAFSKGFVTLFEAWPRLGHARTPMWDRAWRRPRFVPTDVCNSRDLFSTTSIVASVHSELASHPARERPIHAAARWDVPFAIHKQHCPLLVPGSGASLTSRFQARCECACRVATHVSAHGRACEPGAPRERSCPVSSRSRRLPPSVHLPCPPTNRRVSGALPRSSRAMTRAMSQELLQCFNRPARCLSRGSDPRAHFRARAARPAESRGMKPRAVAVDHLAARPPLAGVHD